MRANCIHIHSLTPSVSCSVIVPILFWGYLGFEGDIKETAVDLSPDALWRNYSFHGGDLIVLMIEVLINTMPFIPSHVVVVFVICLLYLAEAHLVYAVDGFWIYPFLDTTGGPIWMALYAGVGMAILCAFVAMYYLHRIKNWIRMKSSSKSKSMPPAVDAISDLENVVEGENDRFQPSSSSLTIDSILEHTKVPAPAYLSELNNSKITTSQDAPTTMIKQRSGRSDSSASTLVNIPVSTTTTAITSTATPTHNRRQSSETLFSSSFNAESRLQKVVEEDDALNH
jgi:hypothetical protein